MQTLSTRNTSGRRTTNSGQFTPTVVLTAADRKRLATGETKLKKGQWVLELSSGRRGQFKSASRNIIRQDVLKMRQYYEGMKFSDYQRSL